jgi:thiamine kinase-like enzyme
LTNCRAHHLLSKGEPLSIEFMYDDCIKLMSELEGLELNIQELKGGITNRLYRVKSIDGRDYVFRLYGKKTELFIDRYVEMENLRRLGPLGITPKVVKYLPQKGVTVVEFIPGYVLNNQDFLKEDLWERIIRPITMIHRSGLILPYLFDPLNEVKRFYKILETIHPDYPEFDILGTIKTLEKISEVADVSTSQYVPCHNDLLADNFVLTEDKGRFKEPMFLIDWEYGGMAPSYYDMADMLQEILAPSEVERSLLAIYWEDRNVDYHQYMTDLFKPYPDIYWFLWSLIQVNISVIEFDYYRYGKVKYDNARKNIDHLQGRYGLKK